MQITEGIKQQLGNWWPVMQDLIENTPHWDNLYRFLKTQSQQGRTIIPKSTDTWKSLQLCDRTKVRAIILLMCPYATEREMNGKKVQVANGIPLDCTNTAPYEQPSLYHWWQSIEEQYGFDPENKLGCSIDYLLSEEHVLMMNVSNTCELNKPDSHLEIWTPVMQWFIENVINKYLNGIPVVIVGTSAAKFEKFLNPLANPILVVEHMAFAARMNKTWAHKNMHKWINEIIRQNNGEKEMIRWMRKKGEGKKVQESEYPSWVTTTNHELLKSADELNMPWSDKQ